MGNFRSRIRDVFLEDVKDDFHKTQGYTNPVQFVLALIGSSVGLGNLWRFPYEAYNNGGGAFLIPYFILYFIIGMPLYYLEIYIGQFTGYGVTKCFNMAPFWKGIGYAMVITSFLIATFYSTIVAWIFHYFFGAFRSVLVWNKCDNKWNTNDCIERDSVFGNWTLSIKDKIPMLYCSDDVTENCTRGMLPTVEYFENYVLKSNYDSFGAPSWELSLCLLLTWILVALCIMYGAKGIGKIVYFTAIFPYVVLIIMLIRGLTLPGSKQGISYYLSADVNKLKDINVWFNAGSQVFFSLSISSGAIITYSSYSKFQNNFLKQTILIVIVDCLTSFFSGFAVFAIIGFLADVTKQDVSNVVSSGAGLAFITYPEALANMPVGPLWAILFFFMLFTLGIDSLFSLMETLQTALFDDINYLQRYKKLISFGICTVTFLISLPLICPGGMYLFEAVSSIATSQSFLIIGFFELIACIYVYGYNNVMEDIKMIVKNRTLEPYLLVTWCVGAPLIILVVLIMSFIDFKNPNVNGAPLPSGYAGFGWFLLAITLIVIPICMIYELYDAVKRKVVETPPYSRFYLALLKYVNSPTKDWGPKDDENRIDRYTPLNKVNNTETDDNLEESNL